MKKTLILAVCLNSCSVVTKNVESKQGSNLKSSSFCDFVDGVQHAVRMEETRFFEVYVEFPVKVHGSTDYDVGSMNKEDFNMFFPSFLDEWAGREVVDTYLDVHTGITKTHSADNVRNQIIRDSQRYKEKCEGMLSSSCRIGPLIAEKRHGSWKIVAIYSDWVKSSR